MGHAIKKRIGFRRQFTADEHHHVKIQKIVHPASHEFKLYDLSTSGVGIALGKNYQSKVQLELGDLIYMDLTPFGIPESLAVLQVVRFEEKQDSVVMGTRFRGLSAQATQKIEEMVGLSHMKQILSKKEGPRQGGSKESDARKMMKTLAKEFFWHLWNGDKNDAQMTQLPKRNLTMLVRESVDTTQLWAESPFRLF